MQYAFFDCSTLPLSNLQQEFTPLLSQPQAARAQAIRREHDRALYVVRQGLLLQLLAHQLNTPKHKIQLHYDAYQKPFIAGSPLHFNTSYSGPYVLYAFDNTPCGVDIERIEAEPVPDLLNSEALSAREQAEIRALPFAQQVTAFYSSWVRKEAYLKAVGTGLHQSPQTLDLPINTQLPPALPKLSAATIVQAHRLYCTQPKAQLIACLASINNLEKITEIMLTAG